MALGTGRIERDRPTCQYLGRVLRFGQAICLKYGGGLSVSPSKTAICGGEGRVEIDGLLKKRLRTGVVVRVEFVKVPYTALKSAPCVDVLCWLSHRAALLGVGDSRGDRYCYRLSNFVLNCEDVSEITIVVVGPNVNARFGLDQLSRDAQAIAGTLDAAFEHIPG